LRRPYDVLTAVINFECSDNINSEHDLHHILREALNKGLGLMYETMHEYEEPEDYWELHIEEIGICCVRP
jgi:hypothetical protein